MKKFYYRLMFILTLNLFLSVSACSNTNDDASTPSYSPYSFPAASEVEKVIESKIWKNDTILKDDDDENEIINTTFLKGWTDIPFLSLKDLSILISIINQRGYSYDTSEKQKGLYSYKYYQEDAGKEYPSDWKNDTLYFDAKNQKIYSSDFTRILSPDGDINNNFPGDIILHNDEASSACPEVSESKKTSITKKGNEVVIELSRYGLKMFEIWDAENEYTKLYVPFQVIASLAFSQLAFNGKDYFIGMDYSNADSKALQEYDKSFNGKSRTKLLSEYNYQTLCLFLDSTYCLNDNRSLTGKSNITFLDNAIGESLKAKLHSLDTNTYDNAFAEFVLTFLDDGCHSWCNAPSLWGKTTSPQNYVEEIEKKYATGRKTRTALSLAQDKYYKDKREDAEGYQNVFYVDNMAVIAFDKFVGEDPDEILENWKDSDEEWENLADKNTFAFLNKAFEDIEKNQNVTNVVIDLSNNDGGDLTQGLLALSFIADPSKFYLPIRNFLDKSLIKFYYELGEDFSKDYNFYILTSPVSFSCANYLASICKNQLKIPIVGQKSYGGSGVLKYATTADGALFTTSSFIEMCHIDESGNYHCIDGGVPVDLELKDDELYEGTKKHDMLYGALYEKLAAKYPKNFQ